MLKEKEKKSKLPLKEFIMLQKIYISSKCFSFERFLFIILNLEKNIIKMFSALIIIINVT